MALGTHIILDFYGCDAKSLMYVDTVQSIMRNAAKQAEFSIVTEEYHQFEPHGVSGATIIQESHLSFHGWSEHQYASIDIFYCGENDKVDKCIQYLIDNFKPVTVEKNVLPRGLPEKYQTQG